jgi:hypothetical protein
MAERRVDPAAWKAGWDEETRAAWEEFAAEWEARLEVVEQLRAMFVRLQTLRRILGRRAARVCDLAEQIRRLAEDLEEDAAAAGNGETGFGETGQIGRRGT